MAATAETCDFDAPAPDFTLPATDGRVLSRADVVGPNGLLVMFICNHCPYVLGILDRLMDDARAVQEMGVGVVAICANDATTHPADSFENMAKLAAEKGFPFPYLHDEGQEVARAYGAVCTPDFFGYNAEMGLQYRGRLDAAGKKGRPDDMPRELVEAMRMIAETGQGPCDQVPSMGCSIKWKA